MENERPINYDVTKSLPQLKGEMAAKQMNDAINNAFVVKDSGKREQFESGMVRDTTENKVDYTLIADGPMFKRWAEHLTRGAKKYSKRNWMKANGQAELDRAKESAFRHFMSWYYNETDEDHASGVYFNINLAEYAKSKVNGKSQ